MPNKKTQVHIKKSSGRYELFDKTKLVESLKLAGASIVVANYIVEEIEEELQDGMHINEIYDRSFALLRKQDRRAALTYSLRRSISEMGPTGFPFEDFIGEIYKAKGYQIIQGQIVSGKCIEHEIDIIAYNQDEVILNEVKFHHKHEMKTDVKVAMYIKSRFEDLLGVEIPLINGVAGKMTQGVLITNTKLTLNAMKFGRCSGINMVSWNYPAKGNLHDLIDETRLHPLTCLTTLSHYEKEKLLAKYITTAQELLEKKEVLRELGINQARIDEIQEEIGLLILNDEDK